MLRDDAVLLDYGSSASELLTEPTALTHQIDDNNLDDIWGSDPSSPTTENFSTGANHLVNEPSDIPRLRSEHSTAGYRDGLSSAKNTTIQQGFDEGYSLGAMIGLEIGTLLGLLEGICNAVQSDNGVHESDKQRTSKLIENARKDLSTEEVFGRDWWHEDGTWRYEIPGENVDEPIDFTFKEVVESHPLIKKWKELVRVEAQKWALDLTVLERAEDTRLNSDDER